MSAYLCKMVGATLCTSAQAKNEDVCYMQEIRAQFAEQLRCLEQRTDTQVALIGELQDFFRRRAELEAEHGRALDKLAKSIAQKHKSEKQRRDSWQLHSTCALWQQLVDDTKTEARQRSAIADLYANHVVPKLSHRLDDIQRISRKCREIGSFAHGEISRVLSELHTAMKTYQMCYAQCAGVEAKFRIAEHGKVKYEEANPNKIGATRKHRALEREFEKKQQKYQEFKLKALKARNEYLLCIDAANAALHKYFAEDLSDLIDCMDLGMQHWLSDLITTVVSARKALCQNEMDALAELSSFKDSLDAKVDKQRFFEANHATFMLPRRFDFRPYFGDDIRQLSAQKNVQDELVQRFRQIQKRLSDLKFESEEVWKTLETAEKRVLELQTEPKAQLDDLQSNGVVDANGNAERKSCKETDGLVQKRKQDLAETEDFYLNKFHHYLLNANLIQRLQARHDCIGSALGVSVQGVNANLNGCNGNGNGVHDSSRFLGVVVGGNRRESQDGSSTEDPPTPGGSSASSESGMNRPPCLPPKPRKKRIGATVSNVKRPKLFGGSLEEYVEATGEEIPLVVVGCIRMLTLYGLHHQGIFRVSGSHTEINAFRDSFEKGDDPLANCVDASDVNPVAGVLKLYFRELREPLFPIYMFDQFTECAKYPNKAEFLAQVRPLINSLPRPTILVLRYLFSFLNHLSQYSDENMMDPYNLAICFGPTLLPIPEGKDQVFYHNFVNELVKNLIIFYEDVFNWDMPGPTFEKYLMCDDNAYADDGEGLTSLATEEEQAAAMMMMESVIDSLPAVDEDVTDQSDADVPSRDLSISAASTDTRNYEMIAPTHEFVKKELVWTKRTISEPRANDDDKCYEKIWNIHDRNTTNPQLTRLRTNRLSLQTSSPPMSPVEKENGRCASASSGGGGGNGHSAASSPRQCDVGSGGLSPTSLQEIQTELKAVLNSLDQFSYAEHSSLPASPFADKIQRSSDPTKPDLVRSLPYTKAPLVDRSTRAGSETKDAPPKPPKPTHKWSASMTCSTPAAFEVRKF